MLRLSSLFPSRSQPQWLSQGCAKDICPKLSVWFWDDVRCLGRQPTSYGSDFSIAEVQSNCIYHTITYVRSQQLAQIACVFESSKICLENTKKEIDWGKLKSYANFRPSSKATCSRKEQMLAKTNSILAQLGLSLWCKAEYFLTCKFTTVPYP